MKAELVTRRWRRVDLKVALDGELHVIRWRRGLFSDEVFFDDRKVAESAGLFGRETIFGLEMKRDQGEPLRLLFSIDPAENCWDFTGDWTPGGVRLESADEVLLAIGTLGPGRVDRMRDSVADFFDRASKALGLS